jgi:hypothetical protein
MIQMRAAQTTAGWNSPCWRSNMAQNKLDFKTQFFFPGGVVFVGAVLILFSPLVMVSHLTLGIMVLFGGLVTATTHVRIGIDLQNKTYREYIVFLGLRVGKYERFQELDYLFVRKAKVSQRRSSYYGNGATKIYSERYEGYLHYDGDVMLHLFSQGKKAKVVEQLNKLSTQLNLSVVDKTGEV